MSMVRGMGHEHGTWHGFTSHQELGSLISGGGCDVQRVSAVGGLELSDTGSHFRVGDTKGRIWASTGKSTFKTVTVSLIWSVHMVHSISVAAQDRLRGDQDGGTC